MGKIIFKFRIQYFGNVGLNPDLVFCMAHGPPIATIALSYADLKSSDRQH